MANKEGTTLSNVAEQSARYANSLPELLTDGADATLPFFYESTSIETNKVCHLEVDDEFSIYESIITMRSLDGYLTPSFLLWMRRSRSVQRRMLGRTVGSTVGHLNLGTYRKFLLPIPPIAEQHQIVADVEARTTAIEHLEAELDL